MLAMLMNLGFAGGGVVVPPVVTNQYPGKIVNVSRLMSR